MIIKSFELSKIKLNNHKFYLFYGDNEGLKEEITEEEINFVGQINGKKRSILKTKRDMSEDEILEEIKSNNETKKLLKDQKVGKTIFVSNRLINIIL